MSRIVKRAAAGTLESSDVFVEIEPGDGGIEVEIESVVLAQFGDAIRAAALDLAKRTERRKILMVLSDGLPSGYFSEAEAIDDVRTAVQAARRRGLLVIPIIYTARTDENVDAYRRMYEKSMIFADSVGMLGEFERLLMKLVR